MDDNWETVFEDAIDRLKHDPHLEQADLYKTESEVFDLPTMKTLSKLINDRYLDTLDFPVSTGKEGNVFRGTTPDGDHVAVKIYRVNTSSFRSHLEYLVGDPRFKPQGKSDREKIEMWASKEYRNLERFREAGLPVPEPVTVENNVVLMEFIGEGRQIAPMLKDVELAEPYEVYNTLAEFVRTAWTEAELVHGDLSPFNVLALDDEIVVIDVAQAVVTDHPRSRELLVRDVENLAKYFGRIGADVDPDQLIDELSPEVNT